MIYLNENDNYSLILSSLFYSIVIMTHSYYFISCFEYRYGLIFRPGMTSVRDIGLKLNRKKNFE